MCVHFNDTCAILVLEYESTQLYICLRLDVARENLAHRERMAWVELLEQR